MSKTKTRSIDLQRLSERGAIAPVIIKLMMACNDLQTADQSLAEWRKEQPSNRRDQAARAVTYFVRLLISHLFEGMKIIGEIRGNADLMRSVESSDAQTQASFNALLPYLKGGNQRAWLEKMMGQVRSNLVFHYDESGKLITRALADRASRDAARYSLITRGSTAHLWHFKPGDDVLDSIVVRQIWEIPTAADVHAEIDNVFAEIKHVFVRFMDFSGEFIWNCTRRS